jgi:hypothetical protein
VGRCQLPVGARRSLVASPSYFPRGSWRYSLRRSGRWSEPITPSVTAAPPPAAAPVLCPAGRRGRAPVSAGRAAGRDRRCAGSRCPPVVGLVDLELVEQVARLVVHGGPPACLLAGPRYPPGRFAWKGQGRCYPGMAPEAQRASPVRPFWPGHQAPAAARRVPGVRSPGSALSALVYLICWVRRIRGRQKNSLSTGISRPAAPMPRCRRSSATRLSPCAIRNLSMVRRLVFCVSIASARHASDL